MCATSEKGVSLIRKNIWFVKSITGGVFKLTVVVEESTLTVVPLDFIDSSLGCGLDFA